MYRWFLCLVLLALCAMPVMAQDEQLDDLNFDEAPIRDEKVPYFAIGIGVLATFNFLPVDDLNVRTAELELDALSSPMIMWGGEAFTAIGFVPDIRIGFSWTNGRLQSEKGLTIAGANVTRTLDYHVSMSALHVDYAIVLGKGLALLPGVGIGIGTQTLTTYQAVANRTWSDYDSLATAPDMFSELTASNFYIPARLNLEYAVTPFIAIRGQASYALQVATGDWTGNRTSTVTGVPDGISLSAFNAQVGLFVGLFN